MNFFLRAEPASSERRRYHCQDVQYHYFRPRVSLGKVNVYKVEPRLRSDPSVSRSWQFLVTLTRVKPTILCETNHRKFVSQKHFIARYSISHGFDRLPLPLS